MPCVERMPDEPADDAVSLPERQAAAHEQVGDVGGGAISSAAAAAIRSRSNWMPGSIPASDRRQSSIVSAASNSGSLSSWRSLL